MTRSDRSECRHNNFRIVLTVCSVIALTKIYELHDARIAAIEVKGDLIVRDTGRIMTRSRARQQPDEYTSVSCQLKIVKVLLEELLSASGNSALGAAAREEDDDDDPEDDEWEDDNDDVLDLSTGMTKSELMALGEDDGPIRGKDNETQSFLVDFFKQQAGTPQFIETFSALTPAEQEKLRSIEHA